MQYPAKSTATSMPEELKLDWLHIKPAEAFSGCATWGCHYCMPSLPLCNQAPLSGYANFWQPQLEAQPLFASTAVNY